VTVGEEPTPGWPVALRGVTETVVATLGPDERWNLAALGVSVPAAAEGGDPPEDAAVARTWGRTRTRRNFAARGEGYVQFTRDPVDFVEAALTVRESATPVLDSADAWVRVAVEERARGEEGATDWVDWVLHPREAEVVREVVPTTNRGYGAVVEASVAASRLDVPAYDTAELEARLDYFESVVATCGGPREREAFERLLAAVAD